MIFIRDLTGAFWGWLDLIIARKEGAERFNGTREGLIRAVVIYVVAVALTMLVPGLWSELPDYSNFFVGLLFNCVPVAAVGLVIWMTVRLVGADVTLFEMLVPAVYALTFILLLGLFVALIGPMFANSLLGVLGYMFYRLARDVGKMNIGVSIAFACLGIVALVAPTFGLYMLSVPAPSAA